MTPAMRFDGDQRIVTITIPLAVEKRGGRKHVLSPDGAPSWAPPRKQVGSTVVKALARAFNWRRLLEGGVYATTEELAAAEKVNPSYVSRVLRLTLLAPEIVDAILGGRVAPDLARLLRRFPVEWNLQRQALGVS